MSSKMSGILYSTSPPVNPFVGALPLLFVVTITALKQVSHIDDASAGSFWPWLDCFDRFLRKGYEDILRHRADRQTNNTPVRILRNGAFKNLKWKDIKVSRRRLNWLEKWNRRVLFGSVTVRWHCRGHARSAISRRFVATPRAHR